MVAVTVSDVKDFAVKELLDNIVSANKSAFWGDVKNNNYFMGQINAYEAILQRLGCAVESTVQMNADFKIQTVLNVTVNGKAVYGKGAGNNGKD